jgi:O-antigen/teichoic acid export membrane protein
VTRSRDSPGATAVSAIGRDAAAAADSEARVGVLEASLGSGASLAMVAQVAIALASAVLGVIVARILGPAGNGSFNVALSTLLVLGAFSNAGVGQGLTYYVSRRRWHAGDALRQAQFAALALGTAGTLVGVAVAASAQGGIFRGAPLIVFVAAAAALPFWLSQTYSASVALAIGRYGIYTAAVVGHAFATLFAVAGLAAAFGLVGAIVGFIAAQVATALALLAWGTRTLRATGPLRAAKSLSNLARAVRFGSKPYLANALQYLNLRADLFILNAVAPSAAVGHYSVAVSVMMVGLLLPTALATAALPRIAALDAFASPGEQLAVSVKSVRHAVLVLPFTCVVLSIALFAVPFVYGEEFAPAVELGFILLPGTLAYGIGAVMTSNIVGKGHPAFALYAAALVTPPTLVLYLLLVPTLEGVGAALASTLSYLSMTAVLLVFFRRATGIKHLGELVPRRTEFTDYRVFAASAVGRAPKALPNRRGAADRPGRQE